MPRTSLKIPLVKREGVQVVLDQETAKNPPPKEFTPERFYDNSWCRS
jgi:hypothetical protein